MNRQELIRDMKQSVGGASFITVTQLSSYLGKSDKTKVQRNYCRDLEKVGNGYFIPDVVTVLMDRRTLGGSV